jgi:hypothetical protein
MAVSLNHTIVAARDAETSARWFAEMFGLDDGSGGQSVGSGVTQ